MIFFTAQSYTATALSLEQKYLRVITKNAPFYLSENKTEELCCLPYTYYVLLLNETENFYHVQICQSGAPSIDGYVEKQHLFNDGLQVTSPYPNVNVTTAKPTPIYNDSSFNTIDSFVFAGRNLNYYGYVNKPDGKYAYLISYGDKLGYVKEEDLSPFSFENHPNPLTFLPTENPPLEVPTVDNSTAIPNTPTSDNNVIKILVIGCLVLAGIIALVISFKPRKKSPATSYYDENEYE